MRRHCLSALVAVILLAIPRMGHAQTYFHVDQIAVDPSSPTDQDNVQLQVSGNLSSTESYVDTAFASASGFGIHLTIDAASTGGTGIPVLVPHTETITLGQLAAGTYTVTITGIAVDDSAPAAQHSFTVAGGTATACDSLIITSVSWAPFSDTALLVHVFNPTSELFDYPGFILLDANGDTLAKETVNFFGIGAESWHLLTVQPGAVIPEGPFNGTLELWELFYGTFACSWNLPFDLCPPMPCAPLTAYIANNGGALAIGTFQYTIRHSGDLVANGTFEMTDNAQYDSDPLCLPPGNYLMEVVADQAPSGGQPYFGVSLGNGIQGPTAPVIVTTLSAVAFNFYQPCADAAQQVAEVPAARLVFLRNGSGISISRTDGHALGRVEIYDAQGRLAARTNETSGSFTFHAAGWAPGLYVLRATSTGRQILTARWVKD